MTDAPPSRPAARPWVRWLRLAGWLAGAGVLVYLVYDALRPEKREQLERLLDAGPGPIAAIVALSAGTVIVNALTLWVLLRPIAKLPPVYLSGVNWAATLLNYAPGKLGAITRAAWHNRLDGIPFATVMAWMGAYFAVLACGLLPTAIASSLLDRVDGLWITISLAGPPALALLLITLSRLFEGDAGHDRMHAIARSVRLKPVTWFLRTSVYANLHDVFALTSRPSAVWGALLLRLADTAIQAARFAVASAVLGLDLSTGQTILLGATYFLIQASSPVGSAGVREGGTIAVGAVIGIEADALVIATLFVTASELATLILGIAPAMWLVRRGAGTGEHVGGALARRSRPPTPARLETEPEPATDTIDR
ncbi:MAG: lysylphosphatidylglycerol synthase domain-containing protein [Planctomycetota bacterium]